MSFSAITKHTEKACSVAQRSKYHTVAKDHEILPECEVQGLHRLCLGAQRQGASPWLCLCLEVVTMGYTCKAKWKGCCCLTTCCVLQAETDPAAVFRVPALLTKCCRFVSPGCCVSHSLPRFLRCTKCISIYAERFTGKI